MFPWPHSNHTTGRPQESPEVALEVVLGHHAQLERTVLDLRGDLLGRDETIAKLNRCKSDLQDKLLARDDTIGNLRVTEADLSDKIKALQAYIPGRHAENEDKIRACKKLERTVLDLRSDLNARNEDIAEFNRWNSDLQDKLRAHNDTINNSLRITKADLSDRIKVLQEQVGALQAHIKDSNANHKGKIRTCNDTIAQLQATESDLLQKISILQAHAKDLSFDLEGKIQARESTIAKLQSTEADLSQKITALQAADGGRAGQLWIQIQDLQRKARKDQAKITQLQQEKEYATDQLQSETNRLEDANQLLQGQLQAVQNDADQRKTAEKHAQQTIATLHAQINLCRAEMERKKQQGEKYQQQLQQQMAMLQADAKKERDELLERITKMRRAEESSFQHITELQGKVEKCKQEAAEAAAERNLAHSFTFSEDSAQPWPQQSPKTPCPLPHERGRQSSLPSTIFDLDFNFDSASTSARFQRMGQHKYLNLGDDSSVGGGQVLFGKPSAPTSAPPAAFSPTSTWVRHVITAEQTTNAEGHAKPVTITARTSTAVHATEAASLVLPQELEKAIDTVSRTGNRICVLEGGQAVVDKMLSECLLKHTSATHSIIEISSVLISSTTNGSGNADAIWCSLSPSEIMHGAAEVKNAMSVQIIRSRAELDVLDLGCGEMPAGDLYYGNKARTAKAVQDLSAARDHGVQLIAEQQRSSASVSSSELPGSLNAGEIHTLFVVAFKESGGTLAFIDTIGGEGPRASGRDLLRRAINTWDGKKQCSQGYGVEAILADILRGLITDGSPQGGDSSGAGDRLGGPGENDRKSQIVFFTSELVQPNQHLCCQTSSLVGVSPSCPDFLTISCPCGRLCHPPQC